MQISPKYLLLILIGVIVFIVLIFRGCNPSKPDIPINPVIAITPVTDIKEIQRLNLPNLPNNEEPKVVITIPKSKPIVGKIIVPHVVIGSKGNTYIAYTTKIDWGLRVEPKISFGISDEFLVGLDITFFSWGRFNTDLLGYLPIEKSFDIKKTRVGAGVSYKVTSNTSIGLGYLKNFKGSSSFVGLISLKF